MTSKRTITISFSADASDDEIHKRRNFGEDLWREIEVTKMGDIGGLDAIEAARDQFAVYVKHARQINRVKKRVHELLDAHMLSESAKVT